MGDVIAQAFASSGDQVNGPRYSCDRSNPERHRRLSGDDVMAAVTSRGGRPKGGKA